MRPSRSLCPLVELSTPEPALMVPEYTRKKQSFPTNGSVIILKASAENGSESLAGRSFSSPVSDFALDRPGYRGGTAYRDRRVEELFARPYSYKKSRR
jgi:hypothetical protein